LIPVGSSRFNLAGWCVTGMNMSIERAMQSARDKARGAYDVICYRPGRGRRGKLIVAKELGEYLAARYPGSFPIEVAIEGIGDQDAAAVNVLGDVPTLKWSGLTGTHLRWWDRFVKDHGLKPNVWDELSYATNPMSETYWCS